MASARGYIRVSSGEQAASGLGLEAQRAAVAATATRLGLSLVAVHEDAGLSGALSIEDRPGLFDALQGLKRGDVLICAKRDRIARDPIVMAMVERLVARRGARLVSAAHEGGEGDDPVSVLTRRMLDAFAEFERLMIGARTKAALRAKRARGYRAGALPFGYTADDTGRLTAVAHELETLSLIRNLRATGKSYGAIAALLEERKITSKRGTRWHAETVRSVLATAATAPAMPNGIAA